MVDRWKMDLKTVLQLIALTVGAIGMWTTLNNRVVAQETKVQSLDKQLQRMEDKLDRLVEKVVGR